MALSVERPWRVLELDLHSLALRYRDHPAAQKALRNAVALGRRRLSTAVTSEQKKVSLQQQGKAHRTAASTASLRDGFER